MNKHWSRLLRFFLAFSLLLGNFIILFSATASAATYFTNANLTLSSDGTGQTAWVRVQIVTSATGGGTSLAINFNGADTTTWTGSGGLVNTTQTASVSTCPAQTGASALPGTLSASGSGSTITITGLTALAASTSYCVDLTGSAVTNPTTAAQYHPTITASDTATVSVDIVPNDQIVVNGVVNSTFSLTLSSNTDSFTTDLSPSSVVSTNGVTVTVNTNASNGWDISAYDSNSGLKSASQGITINSTMSGTGSPATLTAGTAGYVTGVTSITQGTGTGISSIDPILDATASSGVNDSGNGLISSTIFPVVEAGGTADNASFVFKERASISPLTPAATDYTDSITIIGSGSF